MSQATNKIYQDRATNNALRINTSSTGIQNPQETWKLLRGFCGDSFAHRCAISDLEALNMLFNKIADFPTVSVT